MFNGNPTEIDGFKIPYDGVLFLIVLGIHITAGLACVISGAWAMLSKKQRGSHTKAGAIYFAGMYTIFFTASWIAFVRWKEDYHLFILGTIAFLLAFAGRQAAKRKWKRWSIYHISCMGSSYIFLLIAFYVDNGKFLPLWKNIAPVFYWLLPVIIGFPILARTLLTNPLSRNYFRKIK